MVCQSFWVRRFVFVTLDATIFPANSKHLMSALNTMATTLGMASRNLGHIQLPVPQTNTTSGALVKHRRLIEDTLLSGGFDVTNNVALVLEKPADATEKDRRGGSQACISIVQDPKASSWTAPSAIGPVKLVRVMDMCGYDPDNRPGATARAEQTLCLCPTKVI